jgi:hypothetical protein
VYRISIGSDIAIVASLFGCNDVLPVRRVRIRSAIVTMSADPSGLGTQHCGRIV